MKRVMMIVLTCSVLAACSSTPTAEQEGAGVEDRNAKPAQPAKPATSTASTKPTTEKAVSGNPLKDPANILSKRSVYFDLDSNVVKDEYKPVVSAHSRYLQQNRGVKITIQGHADERGSREYNLALGQRRADALKQAMQLLGVQASQVETISYGEEKPKATGHDEAAWSENRRADIAYPND